MAAAAPSAPVPDQDATLHRIRAILTAASTALLEERPALGDFRDRRPERDRSSGDSWHGLQTLRHVSALLAATGPTLEEPRAIEGLLTAVDRALSRLGLRRTGRETGHALHVERWTSAEGDELEVMIGVTVALRAISAPFLPGSLSPRGTTSPVSPLSPLTPPPRRIR